MRRFGLGQPGIVTGVGAMFARLPYGLSVPLPGLPADLPRRVGNGERISIDAGGEIAVAAKRP